MTKAVIKLEKVSKDFYIYRKNIQRIMGILFGKEPAEVKHALKEVSLEVQEGERVFVFGDVDSGRSTLLKVIARVNYPTKGKVRTNGKIDIQINNRVGVDNEQTCIENIYNKGNIIGLTRKQLDEKMDEIISFAEMNGYEKLAIKGAPKGAIPLFSLAVYLMDDADIFLIDEVFTGGGADPKKKCERLVRSYLRKHIEKTAVIVTNTYDFAREVGTRGIVMREGEIIFDGSIDDAIERYDVIRNVPAGTKKAK